MRGAVRNRNWVAKRMHRLTRPFTRRLFYSVVSSSRSFIHYEQTYMPRPVGRALCSLFAVCFQNLVLLNSMTIQVGFRLTLWSNSWHHNGIHLMLFKIITCLKNLSSQWIASRKIVNSINCERTGILVNVQIRQEGAEHGWSKYKFPPSK